MAIYGYIRVSAARQAESGLGLAAQRRRIEAHARTIRGHKLARVYQDAAVSARRHPFLQRQAGAQLDQAAQRGDHIVFARLDRAFRNLRDCATMLERWAARGVSVHLLDLGVDTSTPVGQLVVGIMAAIAQWESQRIGERIRDAKAVQRALGYAVNGRAMLGYRLRGKKLLPDARQRRIIRRIRRLRRAGHTYRAIAERLNREAIKTAEGRAWSHQAAWRAYRAGR